MIMPLLRLIGIYAVIAVVLLVVFNRDAVKEVLGIAGDGSGQVQVDPSLPAIPPPPAASAPETAAAEDAVPAPQGETAAADPEPAATTTAPTPEPPARPPAETATATRTEPPAEAPAKTAPPVLQTPVAARPEPAPTQAPEQTAQPAATPAQPAAAPETATDRAGDPAARLAAARRAYWQGEGARAEALYKALVADDPDNPDYAGELGNIYYAMGRTDQAAELYARAAELLLNRGDTARARALITVLQGIAPDRAAPLQSRLRADN